MSETGLLLVAGGMLAAVGMGYYLGRKGAVVVNTPTSHGVSYQRHRPDKTPDVAVPVPPVLPITSAKQRAPHAPTDTEIYYKEVEGPPKEYW